MKMCRFQPIGEVTHQCIECGVMVESELNSSKIRRNCGTIELPKLKSRIGNKLERLIATLGLRPNKPCRCAYIRQALNHSSVVDVWKRLDWWSGWIARHTWVPKLGVKFAILLVLLHERFDKRTIR